MTRMKNKGWHLPRQSPPQSAKSAVDIFDAARGYAAINIQIMISTIRCFALSLLLLPVGALRGAEYPAPNEGDYIIRDFKFTSGETLPELKIHYRTIGKPVKDEKGAVRNAVLITHGTTGSGAQFIRPEFGGELFGAGQ